MERKLTILTGGKGDAMADRYAGDLSMVNKRRREREVEEIIALDRMQNEARYRSRGRHLKDVSIDELMARWIAFLRREYIELAVHRRDGVDIATELQIRGKENIKLPEDVVEAMIAAAREIILNRYPAANEMN